MLALYLRRNQEENDKIYKIIRNNEYSNNFIVKNHRIIIYFN